MSEALPLLLVLLPLVGALLLSALPVSAARLRALACILALATAGLVGYAATLQEPSAFNAPWFRFQNLEVQIHFALHAALIPLLAFSCSLGALACATTPIDDDERPRAQLGAVLAWIGLSNAAAMAQDLILLSACFELLALAWLFALVSRRREDAVTSAATLLLPSLLGSAALFAVVVHVTITPFPVEGALALSADLAVARSSFATPTSPANWLLLALAFGLLPRAMLWPAHGAWTQLQHRITPNGALLGMLGGLAIASWLFVSLSRSYASNASVWGHAALPWIFALGMLGLGVLANLRESVRRRVCALVMVPLAALPMLLCDATPQGASAALFGVLSVGTPACTLIVLAFVFAERRKPGRLRDLGGVARSMPLFTVLFVAAALLTFGAIPGTASAHTLEAIATQLREQHVALWLVATAGYASAQFAALVILFCALRRSKGASVLRDLSLREFAVAALPLLVAGALSFFADDVLSYQSQALADFFAANGSSR